MRIAARFADVWDGWCSPELLIKKCEVLDRHCAEIGRDPATIKRTTQAFVARTAAQRDDAANGPFAGRPWIHGSDDEITDQPGRLTDAGADELIIADWNLRTISEVTDTLGHVFELATTSA